MSIVEYGTRSSEPFILYVVNWRRNRVINNLVRNGDFTMTDKEDLATIKTA